MCLIGIIKQIETIFEMNNQIPKFGSVQHNISILHLSMIRELNKSVIDKLFEKMNNIEYVQEKTVIETMINCNSMNAFICWYPNCYDFSLSSMLNVNYIEYKVTR